MTGKRVLYQEPQATFFHDVMTNLFTDKMTKAATYYNLHPSNSELMSWGNNAPKIKDLLQLSGVTDTYVTFEYLVPYNMKRIDCILYGRNSQNQGNVVHIELKQWDNKGVRDTDCEGNFNVDDEDSDTTFQVQAYTGGGHRLVSHPSQQVRGYNDYLTGFIEVLSSKELHIEGLAYCYNYRKNKTPNTLFDEKYSELLQAYKTYAGDEVQELAQHLQQALGNGDGETIFHKMISSPIRPSKKLLESAANLIHEGNVSAFALIEEQIIARNVILDKIRKIGNKKSIIIVKGGPGTGKTTTINAMIHFFEEEGADILLAAPTGRAAKRMTEATGCEAQTIHRLLEVSGNPEDDDKRDNVGFGNGFGRNAENPLESDVIIIDEMSMVDLPLMKALLDAIMPGTRLIMVGDGNQLPSVGPGRVLKDIIASDCFPVVKLEKIFRQAKESDIIVNAHKINRGEPVILDNKSMDFFFLKRSDPNVIISVVITLIQKKLPKFVDASPYDIQVLTPMRKGNLGVERLNKILQQYLNPPSPQKQEKEVGDRLLREGDKVMQIKNNYQLEWEVCTKYGMTIDKGLGVFNGDMGIIKNINTYEETVTVEYDEQRQVKYPYAILDELELAYAITIHKAQGSEYPAVVIPLLQGPRQLYNRNLIYTAVTRARKCVTLVGSDSVFQEMIQNTSEQRRNTSLAERIRELA